MKFTSYASRMRGTTVYLYGGKALDFDTGGGLEDVLEAFLKAGAKRVVITLGPMKFLHATLFSTLLNIQRQLAERGGDLVLAEVPWFVEQSLSDLGVLHRFAIVPSAQTVERAEQVKVNLDALTGRNLLG